MINPFKKAKRQLKRDIAKATGIPTTKSGRRRKVKTGLINNGWFWLIVVIAAAVYVEL
jgi:hypothetical protein